MHAQHGSLTLQKQTTDHTKRCSPNRYRLHKIHSTPTPSRGNSSPPSYLPYGHKRHTHLHINIRSTAPPTLHVKHSTNTEKHRSDTRTTPATTRYATLFLQSWTIALWGPTSTQSLPERHGTPSLLTPSLVSGRPLPTRQGLLWTAGSRCNWGNSTLVPSYMHRLGPPQDDSCPNCGQDPVATEHVLLQCPHTHNIDDIH